MDRNKLKEISERMNHLIKEGKHKDEDGNNSTEYLLLEFEFEKERRLD